MHGASCQSFLRLAQRKFHATVTSDLCAQPVHYKHPLSSILLLQHHSPELQPLLCQLTLLWEEKSKRVCYYPYLLLFPHATFIFFSLYHLLPLNTLNMKYLSAAVPRALDTFQNQKAALTELFYEWEVTGEAHRIFKSQFWTCLASKRSPSTKLHQVPSFIPGAKRFW